MSVDEQLLRLYLAERDVSCPTCGYNLRGASGACPECGRAPRLVLERPAPPAPARVAFALLIMYLVINAWAVVRLIPLMRPGFPQPGWMRWEAARYSVFALAYLGVLIWYVVNRHRPLAGSKFVQVTLWVLLVSTVLTLGIYVLRTL